ncbi:MarR family winged helix-turn-helix transcriptional regulator [Clostridium guangxiense]|uniref:MarR family winged helix-turn-helix transcriptional regulator n=1 Tax=Clostridium guangxiense TaxID=1662055 RepID=UPI001E2A9F62|nr:MarR family transcriptional regulator [Clostridium guangxiense]MCD2348909.1 MarR family transcriptional regulator [Clostridium guangxiense]
MMHDMDKYPGYWIRRIFRIMNVIYDKELSKYNLTSSQISVLFNIWNKDGITQKEIQEKLNLRAASVTGLVDTLCDKKFITRIQDVEDARVKRLYLTEKGTEAEKLSTDIIKGLESIISSGLTEDEKVIFVSWLKKAYNNFYSMDK